jgi:hypothetical protein
VCSVYASFAVEATELRNTVSDLISSLKGLIYKTYAHDFKDHFWSPGRKRLSPGQ